LSGLVKNEKVQTSVGDEILLRVWILRLMYRIWKKKKNSFEPFYSIMIEMLTFTTFESRACQRLLHCQCISLHVFWSVRHITSQSLNEIIWKSTFASPVEYILGYYTMNMSCFI